MSNASAWLHENTAFALWADETLPLGQYPRECGVPDRLMWAWARAPFTDRCRYREAANQLLDLPEFGPRASPR